LKSRKETVFNLKNPECQAKFTLNTENNLKLRNCFKSEKPFPDQCNKFFKSLNDIMHASFKKVCFGTKTLYNDDISKLMNEQSELKKNTNGDDISQLKISEKIGTQNANSVLDYIKSLSVDVSSRKLECGN